MERHRFEPPRERFYHLRDDEIASEGNLGDAHEDAPRIHIDSKLVLQWIAKDGTPGRTARVQLVAQMGQEDEGYKPLTSGTKLYESLVIPSVTVGTIIDVHGLRIRVNEIISEEDSKE